MVDSVESPNQDIVVVIPAYNEWIAIGSVILASLRYAGKVIVVDDGSKDRTSEISRLAGAEVITLSQNVGKTAAILKAFDRAKEVNAKVTIMLDGDGQHDPADIPKIAAPILAEKADLVIGSRFLEQDTTEKIPSYRMAGLKVLNRTNEISAGIKCSDAVSGYRGISRTALHHINFEAGPGCYDIEPQMLSHFVALGLTIAEVPITVTYDVPHKHKMNPIRQGVSILTGIIQTISLKRPLIFFGIPGIICILIGMGLATLAIDIARLGDGWPILPTLGTVLFILMGGLFGGVAMILYSLSVIMRR
jgi:glycosyltransferase involved in cell wall biosynthesis